MTNNFFKIGTIVTASAMIYSCTTKPEPKQPVLPGEKTPQTPNVLFLFADDMTFDAFKAAGNLNVQTPNIDRLSKNGTRFANTHIRGSICCAVSMPSRAMMLTGKDLYELKQDGTYIPESDKTLPQTFLENGYETFGTGKWHNGKDSFYRSFSNGGNIFFGGMHDHFNTPVYNFDPTGIYSKSTINKGKHSSELFADAAIDFIKDYQSNRPFFAYVSFTAPHDPRTAPQKFHDRYPSEEITLGPDFLPRPPYDTGELEIRDEKLAPFPRTKDIFKKEHADYYAMITHLDTQIGRILDELKKSGKYENTIIVFSADNGLSVGRHGLMGKQHLYEESIRVPLIFTGPEIPANQISETECYLQDIFPTLCTMTEQKIPSSVTMGKNLTSALTDNNFKIRDTMIFSYKNFMRSIKQNGWKLIAYNVNKKQNFQLFNLNEDPYELKDLANTPETAEIQKKLTELLKQKMKQSNDFCNFNKKHWGYPGYVDWGTATSLYK